MSQDSEISIISESGNESKPHLKASHLSAFNPLSNPSLASHYTFYCYNISVSRGQLHNYLYAPRSGPYHVICAWPPITSPMKSSIFRQKDRKTERQKDRKGRVLTTFDLFFRWSMILKDLCRPKMIRLFDHRCYICLSWSFSPLSHPISGHQLPPHIQFPIHLHIVHLCSNFSSISSPSLSLWPLLGTIAFLTTTMMMIIIIATMFPPLDSFVRVVCVPPSQ